MAGFPSGVTVVTGLDRRGRPFRLRVSAFCSLSLHPQLVLACLEKGASTLTVIREAGGFSVNFLAEDSSELSRRFAARGEEKFDGIAWDLPATTGSGPLLRNGLMAAI